jgi:hypothetical protein
LSEGKDVLGSAYQSRDLCLEQGRVDLAIKWQEEIERAEGLENLEFPRPDTEVWCAIRERSMLLLDNVCFSRLRDHHCRNCRYDTQFILVKLCWLLIDEFEDSGEGQS